MDRIKELKRSTKSRSTKTRTKRLKNNSSITSPLDDTLPDDNFLDSFDKFRFTEQQELRTKKVFKKDIRASFNRDSSIEMSFGEPSFLPPSSTSEDSSADSVTTPVSSYLESEAENGDITKDDKDGSGSSEDYDGDASSMGDFEGFEPVQMEKTGNWSNNCAAEKQFKQEINDTNEPSTITLSSLSASSYIETPAAKSMISSSTPMFLRDHPKMSNKPRVLFVVEDSIHELSNVTEYSEASQRIQMKGGKWRRTIFEIRKTKVTLSPRRTLENLNGRQSSRQSAPPQNHAIMAMRRKSVYIKDIPDRRTVNSLGHRQSQRNVVAVNDVHVNVRPRLRSAQLTPIAADDSEHSEISGESTQFTSSSVTVSDLSSCVESIADENERSAFDLGLNQEQLKAQLLMRCRQTDVLPFDEVYSER